MIALHYATHVNKKEKRKLHFHPLLNLRLTPIFLSGHKSGKCISVKGPLSVPIRSLCIVPL